MFDGLDSMSQGLLDRWTGGLKGKDCPWLGNYSTGHYSMPPSDEASRPIGWDLLSSAGGAAENMAAFASGGPVGDADYTSPIDYPGGPLPDDDGSIGGVIIPPWAPRHMHFPSYWEGSSTQDIKDALAQFGRHGDSELVHVSPEEKALLKYLGGSGTRNPHTGLKEFYTDAFGGGMPGGAAASDTASYGGTSTRDAQGNTVGGGGSANAPGGLTAKDLVELGINPSTYGAPVSQVPSKTSSYVSPALREAQAPAGYYSPGEAVTLGLTDRSVAPQYGSGASGVYATKTSTGATNYQASPSLVHGVMQQESNFNPTIMSPTGAMGLMQLMPKTAAEVSSNLKLPYGLSDMTGNPTTDPRANPDTNTYMGRTYLNQMLNAYGGNVNNAVSAYNAGPSKTNSVLAGNSTFAPETLGYTPAVMKYMAQAQAANPTGLSWSNQVASAAPTASPSTVPTRTVLGQPVSSDPPTAISGAGAPFGINPQNGIWGAPAAAASPLSQLASADPSTAYYRPPAASPPAQSYDVTSGYHPSTVAPTGSPLTHLATAGTTPPSADPPTASYRPPPAPASPSYDVTSGYHPSVAVPGAQLASLPSQDVRTLPEPQPAAQPTAGLPGYDVTSGYHPMAPIAAPNVLGGSPMSPAGNATTADYNIARAMNLSPDQYTAMSRNLTSAIG